MEKDTAALAIILPKSQKEYFEYAAALGGFPSLKEFVIFSALIKADEIIEQHRSILRSTRDKQIYFDGLLSPRTLEKSLLKQQRSIMNCSNKTNDINGY